MRKITLICSLVILAISLGQRSLAQSCRNLEESCEGP